MTTQHKVVADTATESDEETPTQLDLARASATDGEAGGPETRPVQAIEDATGTDDAADHPDAPDDGATVHEETVRQQPASRPRKPTLSAAFSRPNAAEGVGQATPVLPPAGPPDALPEGIGDEVDEWSAADQPTVYLAPRTPRPAAPASPPSGRTAGPPPAYAPRPGVSRPQPISRPRPMSRPTPARPGVPPTYPRAQGRWLATPDGRVAPGTPPAGVPRSALPNPRMERFQELRRQRVAHSDGERDPVDARPVTEMVRQWWSDLRPGLTQALQHQREARASGSFPIPAHEPVPTTRLGDAFGRLAASARELTGRAQAVAAPHLRRLHDQAEHATKALVDRIEGSTVNQQAPFLGPGRIAVFFKQGVTVGQAQRLLAASHARPIRLIPRKHGFLALVPPGSEAAISERLREHPYVRDVAYLEYDEYGEPVAPPEQQ